MTRRLPFVLTALLLTGSHAFAQGTAGGELGSPAARFQGGQDPNQQIFSVEFSGGTVAQYLEAIRAALPSANIIGAEGLGQFTVPAISLKEVTIWGALQPVQRVARSGEQNRVIQVWVESGVATVSVIDNGHDESIFAETPEPQIVTRIWNITSLTTGGGMTLTDITGAIETAVSIAADAKPEFRIHEPTGILVVKGLDTQLDLIDEVIGRLQESAAELDNLRAQIADFRGNVAMSQVEVANIERVLAEIEKQAAAASNEDERNDRTDQALGYRAQLEKARVELSEYQARLADLESRFKKPTP